LITNDKRRGCSWSADPKHGDFARGGEKLPRDGVRQRTLEITFLESDAEAYSFTFGQSGDGDG
jgi:hypothetical protein